MSNFTLYTYKTIEEWREKSEQQEIIPFIFSETEDLLMYDSNICIDITTLIHYLRVNKTDRYPAYMNLKEMTEETIIIIDKSLADDAISYFPYLFSNHTSLYNEENKNIENKVTFSTTRCSIYTYHNVNDLTAIITYANTHNIPITTFSNASGDLASELQKFNKSAKLALLDLTSISYVIEDNKNFIYSLELFLNQYQNIKIIILTSQVDVIMKYFPLYIQNNKPIKDILPGLKDVNVIDESSDEVKEVKKVTSLSTTKFSGFIEDFNHNLIGHEHFKKQFEYILRNFIKLNKIKEQKVLSIFLFGISGIGKTEVARLISNKLQQGSYLAKINFQNYSSQDALNSLIGSPAGYIGCDQGELSEKVKKSEVGIILCDEFEKTTIPVSSFFLELLEEGKFTDSMTREYDLDGYIIIFTSNILNKHDYETRIPLELQTRFDLVCEFEEPSYDEKTRFLDLLLEKNSKKLLLEITHEQKQQLYDFDYSNISALRDIKKNF